MEVRKYTPKDVIRKEGAQRALDAIRLKNVKDAAKGKGWNLQERDSMQDEESKAGIALEDASRKIDPRLEVANEIKNLAEGDSEVEDIFRDIYEEVGSMNWGRVKEKIGTGGAIKKRLFQEFEGDIEALSRSLLQESSNEVS